MSTMTTPPVAAGEPQNAATQPSKADARKQAAVKLTLGGDPTVQLLPPSIRDRALARSRIRTGVLLVVLGAVVAAALVVVGTLRTTQADLALQAANDRTTELLSQQAQYTEAVRIDALVKQIEELQLGATSTEIDWAVLVGALLAGLPEGGQLISITAAGTAPWDQAATIGDAGTPVLAVLELSLSTLSIQHATAYSRALSELPGFASSTISQVAVGTDGRVTTTLTLTLTTGAESGRFLPDDDAEGDAEGEAAPDDAAADETADGAADEPADPSTDEQTDQTEGE